MSGCERFEDLIERYLVGEVDQAGLEALRQHSQGCSGCRQLMQLHKELSEIPERAFDVPEVSKVSDVPEERFDEMRAAVLRRIGKGMAGRSGAMRSRAEHGSPAFWKRWIMPLAPRPIYAIPLVIALLALGFALGRLSIQRTGFDEILFVKEVVRQASQERGLAGYWDSPFIYSNVSFQPRADGAVTIDFDVTRHVNVTRKLESPLTREMLVHAMLDPSTMGGDVTLTDVVGDLDAETMGGNVQCENVRKCGEKSPAAGGTSESDVEKDTVNIFTMGGDIVLDEAPAGAKVHTMGGDIVVKEASDFVSAKTMGGNIDLHVTNGLVDATTMAGTIDVTIEGGLGDGEQGVRLSSCCGDVELVVPADLSMDLDLTIAYTRNSSQDFKIMSDLAVQTERSDEWDYTNGEPRKRIHGTGKIAGGKYPIVIETINGDIRLEKAK